jgi:transcriptional regulator with XRE-family HTH domain
MAKLTIQVLGRKLIERRGSRGIREVAKEIGISPATLSRVERGHLPDIDTFGKVCRWLNVDPGEVLRVTAPAPCRPTVSAHFRKDTTLAPTTAKALAQMILAAQRALMGSPDSEQPR